MLLESSVYDLFPFGTADELYAVNDEEFVKVPESVRNTAKGRKDRYGDPSCTAISQPGVPPI